MPWHIPRDLAHFKRTTLGKPVIMGRKTHESIGRALPGRLNIVISRRADGFADGVVRVATLDDALEAARASGTEEAMIIGGGQIYALALQQADRVYLTEIQQDADGDTVFPALDPTHWAEVASEDVAATDAQPALRFVTLDRTA
jgi:dihydrofolate reductase